MDPATLAAVKAAIQAALSEDGRKAVYWICGGVVAVILLVLLAVSAVFGSLGRLAGGGGATPPPGLIGLWVPLVQQQAQAAGIPPILDLGLIEWESGGNYMATHANTNGTTDAGLQQVNSTHWKTDGLAADPFDPAANVAAGLKVLGQVLADNPSDLPGALEAYNGGGPGYADHVLAEVRDIEAGPVLGVWPLGGTQTHGTWTTPALPATGQVTFLVTAFAPLGQAQEAYGQSWPGLVAPATITASAPLTPCSSAPKALAQLLPPDASCWYATVPATAGQPVSLSVTATWQRQETTTYTGPHGHQHTRIRTVLVTATRSATATLAAGG